MTMIDSMNEYFPYNEIKKRAEERYSTAEWRDELHAQIRGKQQTFIEGAEYMNSLIHQKEYKMDRDTQENKS